MTIFDLFRGFPRGARRSLLISATAVSAANALMIIIVGAAVRDPAGADLRLLLMFLLALWMYVSGLRFTHRRASALVEAALHEIRVGLVARVERAGLERLERVGTTRIYDQIIDNSQSLATGAAKVVDLLQSAAVLAFATIYILYLAPLAFVLLALAVAAWLSLHRLRQTTLHRWLREDAALRRRFLGHLNDLLRGFKELKLGARRRADFAVDVAATAADERRISERVDLLFSYHWLTASALFLGVTGLLVLLAPHTAALPVDRLGTLVAVVFSLWGPLSGVLGGLRAYERANRALRDLDALAVALDDAHEEGSAGGEALPAGFGDLELRGIEYEYRSAAGDETFRIGPIDLTIAPGELVFIVGGNGSGKSTLLKVLTALYPPCAGEIRLGGVTIGPDNRAAYRERFAAIYADFHLFARLYGLLDAPEAEVQRLLDRMRLTGRTCYIENRFTRRDLSSGQRRRMAMIVALLEDPPAFVFDEWAADQDPESRREFYEELLPSLRRRGKTVIVVTHDDRYVERADRVVRMDDGRITAIRGPVCGAQPEVVA